VALHDFDFFASMEKSAHALAGFTDWLKGETGTTPPRVDGLFVHFPYAA
jgi:hypothetical protein